MLFDAFFSFIPAWIMVLGASLFMGITLMASIPLATRLVSKRIAAGAPHLDADGLEIPAPELATVAETEAENEIEDD